jgi:hypothetical protein
MKIKKELNSDKKEVILFFHVGKKENVFIFNKTIPKSPELIKSYNKMVTNVKEAILSYVSEAKEQASKGIIL